VTDGRTDGETDRIAVANTALAVQFLFASEIQFRTDTGLLLLTKYFQSKCLFNTFVRNYMCCVVFRKLKEWEISVI